jgi:hypothetical protein
VLGRESWGVRGHACYGTGAVGLLSSCTQAFLNGWGGLRVTATGLKLLPPALPGSVGSLSLASLSWRLSTLTLTVTPGAASVAVLTGPSLCLFDALGHAQLIAAGGDPLTIVNATFAWPGLLQDSVGGACGR